MTPTDAIAATGPDHVNALLMTKSPLPTANASLRAHEQSENTAVIVLADAVTGLRDRLLVPRMPAVPRGTMRPLRPRRPFGLWLGPDYAYIGIRAWRYRPPAFTGQNLRPFRTYSPFFLSWMAVRPMPAGQGAARRNWPFHQDFPAVR